MHSEPKKHGRKEVIYSHSATRPDTSPYIGTYLPVFTIHMVVSTFVTVLCMQSRHYELLIVLVSED